MRGELHPELRLAEKIPRVTRRTAAVFRLLSKLPVPAKKAQGVRFREYRTADLQVRVIQPENHKPTGALLWIHGGGLVVGNPRTDDQRCAEFAKELGIVVVCPYYRLAPKNPFPAAIDDCWAAWQWLMDHVDEFEIEPGRVAIGGESAGGGLAASLAQRIYDRGGPQPAAQLLVYPMLDDRTAARRELDADNHLVWNNDSNYYGWSSYLACEPGSRDVPKYAVPARRKDLHGLPPCWIGVGSLDLFLQEDCDYARRLKESDVSCVYLETEAACHGFVAVAPDASVSRASTRSQLEFLRRQLAPPSA